MICIYPSAIVRFYDEQGNETEWFTFKLTSTKYEILNIQMNLTQHIGTS